MPAEVTVLKRNPKRTVTLERVGGVSRVVKRFHAPGTLDRLRDRHRASREYRALERLRAEGLPVPRPIEVRKRDGHWELVLEQVARAASLDELLAGSAPWPVPAGRVAVELGKLLGTLHARRVEHPDLHAGNVLVDGAGRLVLVDLARARVGEGMDVEELLVSLLAGVRERCGPGFRARAMLAFHAAAPDAIRRPTPESIEILEANARRARRGSVRRRVARYYRESGAMRAFDRAGRRGLARHDVPLEFLDLIATKSFTPWPAEPERAALAVEALSLAELAPRWEAAARLAMHDIPGERPLVLFLEPYRREVLQVPREPVTLEERWPRTAGTERALLAHGAGRVRGALHDRGLAHAPADGLGLLVTPDEKVELGPGRLVDDDDSRPADLAARMLGALPDVDRTARCAFASGFVHALRGTRAERRRVAAELELG